MFISVISSAEASQNFCNISQLNIISLFTAFFAEVYIIPDVGHFLQRIKCCKCAVVLLSLKVLVNFIAYFGISHILLSM